MAHQSNHLPSLNPLEMDAALTAIDQLDIPVAAKAQVKAMLIAAANPDAESPGVVLQTLDPERQTNAEQMIQTLGATFTLAARRGADALNALDDAEWERLVNSE